MQIIQGFNWDATDFIVMGTLVLSTVVIFNLSMKKLRHYPNRLLVGGLIILAFLYIWAELAVGILTNLGS